MKIVMLDRSITYPPPPSPPFILFYLLSLFVHLNYIYIFATFCHLSCCWDVFYSQNMPQSLCLILAEAWLWGIVKNKKKAYPNWIMIGLCCSQCHFSMWIWVFFFFPFFVHSKLCYYIYDLDAPTNTLLLLFCCSLIYFSYPFT